MIKDGGLIYRGRYHVGVSVKSPCTKVYLLVRDFADSFSVESAFLNYDRCLEEYDRKLREFLRSCSIESRDSIEESLDDYIRFRMIQELPELCREYSIETGSYDGKTRQDIVSELLDKVKGSRRYELSNIVSNLIIPPYAILTMEYVE